MNEESPSVEGVYSYYSPALTKIAEGFHRLKHQGSELKKRKCSYPSPKEEGNITGTWSLKMNGSVEISMTHWLTTYFAISV